MVETLGKIHHVGVVVADIDASAAWYVEDLGFQRLYRYAFPGVKAAFIGRGDLKLELFQAEGAAPMPQERQQASTNLKMGWHQPFCDRGHRSRRDGCGTAGQGRGSGVASSRGA